jgi:hypothetical protein
MGRSVSRDVRISFGWTALTLEISTWYPSGGISIFTVIYGQRKEADIRPGVRPETAVTRTNVSPCCTSTAPSACLAILPVSIDKSRPPRLIARFKTFFYSPLTQQWSSPESAGDGPLTTRSRKYRGPAAWNDKATADASADSTRSVAVAEKQYSLNFRSGTSEVSFTLALNAAC